MGVFFERFVRLNAELIVAGLRKLAEKVEETAPGKPVTVMLGWQGQLKPGEETKLDMGEITVSNEEAGPWPATVSFQDAAGYSATPDDVPQWTSSDETVATVTASEDGLTGTVASTKKPGSTIINVHTVNDDGSEIDGVGLFNVSSGDVEKVSVDFGQPTEAPPEETPPEEPAPA